AVQRRRGGAVDADVNELARLPRAGEVDRRVAPRPAPEQRRVGPARPLDEHLLGAPDPGAVAFAGDPLAVLDQALDSLALDLLGDLIRHGRRLRAPPRREDERER